MTGTDLVDINLYLDGELGPEEAAEVEARLESDWREHARFEALWRQKLDLARALEMLLAGRPENLQTAGLRRRLAHVLWSRMPPVTGVLSGMPAGGEPRPEG